MRGRAFRSSETKTHPIVMLLPTMQGFIKQLGSRLNSVAWLMAHFLPPNRT